MSRGIAVWIDLVKKSKEEVDLETDINKINQWISDLDIAMDDIIVGSVHFSLQAIMILPKEISAWFTQRSGELET